MDKSFEYKGMWYLPNQTVDQAIAGIIKFDPNKGIKLELIGSFKTKKSKLEIIWGLIEGNKDVTLYNSFVTRVSHAFSNFEVETYTSNVVFIGGFFDNKKDLSFYKAKASYAHLDEWLNIASGFNIKNFEPERKTEIQYELPKSKKIQISPTFRLIINPTYKVPFGRVAQKGISIVQKMFINFETSQKIQFDKYLETIFHFQNFLTIATQASIYIEELSLYFRTKGSNNLFEAKAYFTLTNIPETKKELATFDMLLPYSEIASDFETIIKNWYNLKLKLEASLYPYTAVFFAPFLYVSDRFLNLCRSMEAFHRDFINPARVHFEARIKEVFKNSAF